jgi:2,3-bisphosphoglycerate-independent phosphoglycerate mutase
VRAAAGTLLITADHGNCEVLHERDSKGNTLLLANGTPVPKKSHTLSPVPFITIDFVERTLQVSNRDDLGLANIAASLLGLLQLPIPETYAEPVVSVVD